MPDYQSGFLDFLLDTAVKACQSVKCNNAAFDAFFIIVKKIWVCVKEKIGVNSLIIFKLINLLDNFDNFDTIFYFFSKLVFSQFLNKKRKVPKIRKVLSNVKAVILKLLIKAACILTKATRTGRKKIAAG